QLGVGGAENVTVPVVIGKQEADATNQLRDAGLKVARKEAQDEVNPAGQVTGQDPAANVQVKKGRTVTITVSSGAPIVEVPDVRNRTLDAATDQLTTVAFRVATNLVNSDKTPNTVLEQSPAANTPLDRNSTVTMVVSTGPAPTTTLAPVTTVPQTTLVLPTITIFPTTTSTTKPPSTTSTTK